MGTGALVSVVVPSFNHQDLIADCLQSVAAQGWPRLELIVLDDCSKDQTFERANETAAEPGFLVRFESLRVERNQRNLGAHATLNRAIASARGEFVAILNSDDRYAPARLETLVGALDGGSELAFSGVRMIDGAGRDITDQDWFGSRLSHTQRCIGAFPSTGFALLRNNSALTTGNFVFRRPLFDRVGGFRPLLYCHDWDFLLRTLLRTEPVFVPAPLYEYRLHQTNSFRALGEVAHRETEAVLTAYFSAIQQGRCDNPLAPSPQNWPGLFETMVAALHLGRHWEQARRCAVE